MDIEGGGAGCWPMSGPHPKDGDLAARRIWQPHARRRVSTQLIAAVSHPPKRCGGLPYAGAASVVSTIRAISSGEALRPPSPASVTGRPSLAQKAAKASISASGAPCMHLHDIGIGDLEPVHRPDGTPAPSGCAWNGPQRLSPPLSKARPLIRTVASIARSSAASGSPLAPPVRYGRPQQDIVAGIGQHHRQSSADWPPKMPAGIGAAVHPVDLADGAADTVVNSAFGACAITRVYQHQIGLRGNADPRPCGGGIIDDMVWREVGASGRGDPRHRHHPRAQPVRQRRRHDAPCRHRWRATMAGGVVSRPLRRSTSARSAFARQRSCTLASMPRLVSAGGANAPASGDPASPDRPSSATAPMRASSRPSPASAPGPCTYLGRRSKEDDHGSVLPAHGASGVRRPFDIAACAMMPRDRKAPIHPSHLARATFAPAPDALTNRARPAPGAQGRDADVPKSPIQPARPPDRRTRRQQLCPRRRDRRPPARARAVHPAADDPA